MRRAVAEFAAAAAGDGNLMPAMIEAFRADLTIGEVTDVLIDQFGPPPATRPRSRTDQDGLRRARTGTDGL